MSNDFMPSTGSFCLYKTRGGVNWSLCRVIAFYQEKFWLHNLSVGSMPVIKMHSVEFMKLDAEASLLLKG